MVVRCVRLLFNLSFISPDLILCSFGRDGSDFQTCTVYGSMLYILLAFIDE